MHHQICDKAVCFKIELSKNNFQGIMGHLDRPEMPWEIFCGHQCSQNVDVNGPHHGPYQLMASSSLHCHRLVE